MNAILTLITAAALTLAGSSAFAEPQASYPAGPVVTNGWPEPPQVFAPETSSRVRGADRSVDAGPDTTR